MLGLLTALLGGCGTPAPPELPNPPPAPLTAFSERAVSPVDVDLAIELALAIQRSPGEHATLLEQQGLSSQAWEALLVDIASDPSAAERYAQALEQPEPAPASE
jgi:hypothetical protein